jgi:uncharacterized hydrophobic protein (TIGR00271 family)
MITLLRYLELRSELESFDEIHATIEKSIVFKGTNLWILVFAVIIASVGLNMNSTAVIIGAMLISPLMGPINGMGYSIATYNFPLFRRAAKNFSFAVGASVVASTTYFAISPVSTAHSELLARTNPTIYDVLIALFGGLAGIIAISSKHKGNVIPGVAIATALMPPLCTASYGLASGQFGYFFGAFYLLTINTVFIAISSVAASQLLRFPIRTIVEDAQRRKVNRWISAIIIVTIIPSIYFGYGLVQQETFSENAAMFTQSVSVFERNYLLKDEINPRTKTITLVYGGNSLTEEHKRLVRERAGDFSLDDAEVVIEQGLSFSEVQGTMNEMEQLKNETRRLTSLLNEKDRQQDSIASRVLLGRQLLSESRSLYPSITTCSFSETVEYGGTSAPPRRVAIVVFTTKGRPLKQSEKEKVRNWLQTRLSSDLVRAYFEE